MSARAQPSCASMARESTQPPTISRRTRVGLDSSTRRPGRRRRCAPSWSCPSSCIARRGRSPIRAPAGSRSTRSCTPTSPCHLGATTSTGAGASCTARRLYQHAAAAGAIARRSGATAWCASWASPRWWTARAASPSSGSPMRSDVSSPGAPSRSRRWSASWASTPRTDTSWRWCRRARARTRSPPPRTSSPNGGSAPRASGSTPRASRRCWHASPRHCSRAGSTWSAAPNCSASAGSPPSTRPSPVATSSALWPHTRPWG